MSQSGFYRGMASNINSLPDIQKFTEEITRESLLPLNARLLGPLPKDSELVFPPLTARFRL